MLIKGISNIIKEYEKEKNVRHKHIYLKLGISEKAFFDILKTEVIAKTVVFYRLKKMIGFDYSILEDKKKVNIKQQNVLVEDNTKPSDKKECDSKKWKEKAQTLETHIKLLETTVETQSKLIKLLENQGKN